MTKKRVAVLISGSGSNLQALIDAAQQPEYPASISLVISSRADAFGLERAQKAGIETVVVAQQAGQLREDYDTHIQNILEQHQIDLVCLAGFMRLLSAPFVTRWEGRMLNIHPSLLPLFKGLHPHRQALEAGVKLSGCTVHFVVPDMDAGPIVAQAAVPVHDYDTEHSLQARVLEAEHLLYPQALDLLARGHLHITGNRVHSTDNA